MTKVTTSMQTGLPRSAAAVLCALSVGLSLASGALGATSAEKPVQAPAAEREQPGPTTGANASGTNTSGGGSAPTTPGRIGPDRLEPEQKEVDSEAAWRTLQRLDPGKPESQLPAAVRDLNITEKLGSRVPLDLEFIDADGQRVKLAQYFDGKKPVLLQMVYYRCPMQCGTVLQKLYTRLNKLDFLPGEKFNIIVVSFDPTETTEAAARARVLGHTSFVRDLPKDINASWAYLTSEAKPARSLADSVGFAYRFLPESREYAHAAVSIVLTPDGKVSRYLYGIDYSASLLRMALLEATDGRIGTTVDRILHFCYRFDPNANQYVIEAFRLMQITGVLTALGLGGLMAGLWVIDRRRKRMGMITPPTPAT